jgi:hypothetical protein
MFVVHKTLLNKRNLKKNAVSNYKISFSFIWYWFIFKYIKYFAFIAEFSFKQIFLMKFQPKDLNFQMALD